MLCGDGPQAPRSGGPIGEHAEAARLLLRSTLHVENRALGPGHCQTLTNAVNLAFLLTQLGEHADAAALLRTALAVWTRTVGSDGEGTLFGEGHLVNTLLYLGEYA